jgi:hypothetical protein
MEEVEEERREKEGELSLHPKAANNGVPHSQIEDSLSPIADPTDVTLASSSQSLTALTNKQRRRSYRITFPLQHLKAPLSLSVTRRPPSTTSGARRQSILNTRARSIHHHLKKATNQNMRAAGAPSSRAAAVGGGSDATAAATTKAAPAAPRLPSLRCRRCSVAASASSSSSDRVVTLLDYGAGNVRSVRNAIKRLGWTIKDVSFLSSLSSSLCLERRCPPPPSSPSSPSSSPPTPPDDNNNRPPNKHR